MSDHLDTTPNLDETCFQEIDTAKLFDPSRATHPPRILLIYGSLRQRSFSRLLSEEAARILRRLGAETRTFNPAGLPLPDGAPSDHPKVQAAATQLLEADRPAA